MNYNFRSVIEIRQSLKLAAE